MSVRVVARIRPLLKQEIDKDTIVTAETLDGETTPSVVRIPSPKNEAESFSFQFSSVYEQDASQQQLFDAEIAPTVKHLFNGFDLSIFAHGCTGTGKTHTMRGGKSLAERGVIPRLLSAIYRRSKKIEKDSEGAVQVEVALEYFEIYCDRVYDLFEPPEKRTPSGLPIRDNKGKTVVVGLTEKPCPTLKEFEQLYDQANMNRSTSSTKLNAHSSRSHAVLCVKITQTTEETVRVSRVSCIDLAGSEDNRRTENNKERLVESSAINKSLFVLAQCVEAMNKKASRIPYRESKMTRILSLGQNKGLTVMILNLAPVRAYHLDTISSLNFASRTKKIEIAEVENDPMYRTAVKPLAATSSVGGATMARQPLRPLAAVANANLADAEKKKGEKPVKAFSVYSDTRKPAPRVPNTTQNTGIRRAEPPKRAAEPSSSTFGLRPTKTYRAADNTSRIPGREPVLTKASIEALIAQKVDERLAEKALQDAGNTAPALPAELQKRLDELEHRINATEEDGKSQGLQFLLMAKQHHIRGEDASALRMYQLAQPFFPDNAKLESKMKTLGERVRAKREENTTATRHVSAPVSASVPAADPVDLPSHTIAPTSSLLMAPLKAPKPKPKPKPKWATKTEAKDDSEDDEEFAPPPPSDHEDDYASDDSIQYKPKAAARKPKKTTKKLPIFRDAATTPTKTTATTTVNPAEQTPRTSQLLKIINSRDVIKIKALKGVGAKKADSIVNCLMEMDDAEIMDLESLAMLKGVGGKTVENMRLGLGLGLGLSVDYDF
ncbi:Kinesin protein [Pyrenophora tritici-repentis]|uniref:Kinesin protein n=2 Tax=Pyrenophora tritici-repentis TaxID=45151 RepID=A0A922T2U3_9PLEO|nr:kinesin-II 95 kDa subunit [Pyrenophora tritici-repentis Pt-1C-BFP]EDU41298.1 kinesin-II 95 kDa subunit [Pyrenophora tritici-repentis Pt-1C-BFP]KAI1518143.1 Kinesin protein [Pyrenophora tritici-repentis]KAI1673874.1 Kinesin protein [Pyrenophora tritici-repentis]KAI1689037.1 Kinesin protein [Pyrenophora tritici-repentis]